MDFVLGVGGYDLNRIKSEVEGNTDHCTDGHEPTLAVTYLQNLKSSEESLKEKLEKAKKWEAAFIVTYAKHEQEIVDLTLLLSEKHFPNSSKSEEEAENGLKPLLKEMSNSHVLFIIELWVLDLSIRSNFANDCSCLLREVVVFWQPASFPEATARSLSCEQNKI